MEDKGGKSYVGLCVAFSVLVLAAVLMLRLRSIWTTLLGSLFFIGGTMYLCCHTWNKEGLLRGSAPDTPATEDAGPTLEESILAAYDADSGESEADREAGVSEDYDSYETEAVRVATGASTHSEPRSFWYPESIGADEFLRRTVYLDKEATAFRVDGVPPEQMRTRAAFALQRLSLRLVTNEIHYGEGQTWAKLAGWARSRGKVMHLGVEVNVSGIAGAKKCLCRVLVHSDASGELQPMLDKIRRMLTFTGPAEAADSHLLTRQTPTLPVSAVQVAPPEVLVERQAIFSGGMLIFTVTVWNKSSYPLQDVDAFLISYPSALLKLITDDSNIVAELGPNLSQVSQFTLSPSSDSSRGEIIAAVSFLTPDGRSYTIAADSLSLVPVRGMLEPDPIEKDEFDLRMTSFQTGETTFKTDDWTPEEMYDKSMRALVQLGFHLVQHHADTSDALLMAEVDGAARGKAMHKPLVVTLVIYGASHAPQTSCRIIAGGEDESMIFPGIEEIKSRLEAWPCPSCKTELTAADIHKLESGGIIKCSSCGKTMDLTGYRNWPR